MSSTFDIPEDEVAERARYDLTIFRKFTEPEVWKGMTLHQHVALIVWLVQQRGLMEKHSPFVTLSERADGTYFVSIVTRDGQGSRNFTAGAQEVLQRLIANVIGEIKEKYKSGIRDVGIESFELTPVVRIPPASSPS